MCLSRTRFSSAIRLKRKCHKRNYTRGIFSSVGSHPTARSVGTLLPVRGKVMEYIVEPVTMPSTANTKRDGLVEPVTMPSAANTKRADNTTGAAYIDGRADGFGGNTSPSERDDRPTD